MTTEFDAFLAKALPAVNKSLAQKKLEAVQPITRKAWDAASGDSAGGPPAGGMLFRERD